ncbi:OmpA family protein [Sphingomonas nostoxanthinifaciens]|uniref:OmpA family protein n=1 Tax=Sphingomonas nostoxanthinifaciens TaxID=2872652 RepID=UPI001CC2091C|nr:OmpA family protein [Sphingomonas nostoxanthinifaciens]UAK25628.1 OmpA family protein [Sphingomonas nostoxanthinifaciens]
MADPKNTPGAPPREVRIEKKKTNWLAWILLALGILAALLALSRCNRHEKVAAAPTPANGPAVPPVGVKHVTLPGGKVVDLQPATLNYDLQSFLASNAAAPRTFTFDKLNFDTDQPVIRADDQPTLSALGQILAAYPKANVRLVGYADARGSAAANAKLGSDRAAAVAKALSDAGIDGKRITTASGGDSNPVASNATAGGQFENRRTELVVTSK